MNKKTLFKLIAAVVIIPIVIFLYSAMIKDYKRLVAEEKSKIKYSAVNY